MKEGTFEGSGGIKLFARSWPPEGAARAVVILQHGFKAHSGLVAWAAEQFNGNGFAAYAMDLRGHGKSDGEHYYVDKFADYVDDLAIFVERVKALEPGLPVFLLGHSAGGVISCGYVLEHQAEINGFICHSFAADVPAPDIALRLLKGVSHIAPHAHVYDLQAKDFSRMPEFVKQMTDDPLLSGSYPVNTVAELARADERIKSSFAQIELPLLIIHGTADRATKPSGSQRFYDQAGSKDKTLKFYEGHYHDLLNDIGREQVMSDIVAWINARGSSR